MGGYQFEFQPQDGKTSSLSEILSGLISQYGIGRKSRNAELEEFWSELAGELAVYSSVGGIRNGGVEILVSDAIFMQELLFRKEELLLRLNERFPDSNFEDLRFRVGSIRSGKQS